MYLGASASSATPMISAFGATAFSAAAQASPPQVTIRFGGDQPGVWLTGAGASRKPKRAMNAAVSLHVGHALVDCANAAAGAKVMATTESAARAQPIEQRMAFSPLQEAETRGALEIAEM